MKNVLMVVAPEQFRDEELFETQEELTKAGIKTEIASTKIGDCKGKLGGHAKATLTIGQVETKNYDAIAFIGGGGSEVYFKNPLAHKLAQQMNHEGKLVSAICIAPVILANAGLLKNKKATVFEDGIEILKNCGARYTGEVVTMDGNIITGNGPRSSKEFGKAVAKKINQS